ncbi:hypothetical protein SAMN04487948_102529 [Halogranum amylolyticum]|uniref:Uncharacterized protein n=1 Tax=Halogranum amylolyticum TaxID=660520 RepID=A0A1H8PW78_9EURY|nr:DUF6069 family protein [Halogranum amylolyticum]SEO46205.1 hypothetical protein SAMN04487948_102529 [Halogranum amylolyticum]
MQSVATPVDSERRTLPSLPERAAIGLVSALVLTGLVRVTAGSLVDVGNVEPLGWVPILVSTVVAALGATGVYAVVSHLSTQPNRHFVVVAAAVLLLSMAPVFTVAATLPDVTTTTLGVLALLHVTAAVGIVAGLTGVVHR